MEQTIKNKHHKQSRAEGFVNRIFSKQYNKNNNESNNIDDNNLLDKNMKIKPEKQKVNTKETSTQNVKIKNKQNKKENNKNIQLNEIDLESILYYNENLKKYESNESSADKKKAYIVYLDKKIEKILENKKKAKIVKKYGIIVGSAVFLFSGLFFISAGIYI